MKTYAIIPYQTALDTINNISFELAHKPDWDADTTQNIAEILYKEGLLFWTLKNRARMIPAVKKPIAKKKK